MRRGCRNKGRSGTRRDEDGETESERGVGGVGKTGEDEGKDFAIAGEINPGEKKTYNVSLRKSSSICGRVRLSDVSGAETRRAISPHLSPVINFRDN